MCRQLRATVTEEVGPADFAGERYERQNGDTLRETAEHQELDQPNRSIS